MLVPNRLGGRHCIQSVVAKKVNLNKVNIFTVSYSSRKLFLSMYTFIILTNVMRLSASKVIK